MLLIIRMQLFWSQILVLGNHSRQILGKLIRYECRKFKTEVLIILTQLRFLCRNCCGICMMGNRFVSWTVRINVIGLFLGLTPHANGFSEVDRVVAVVNGEEITADQLQLDFFLKIDSESETPRGKKKLLDDLIDRELIRQFLARRKVVADPMLVEQKMKRIKKLVEDRGETLDEVLSKLNISEASLTNLLELQVAWQMHLTQTLTEERLQKFWENQHSKFDGTEVEASQIFLKVVPNLPESDVRSAFDKLADIRFEIISGKTSFADAAKNHSHSPSGKNGGQLGRFEFSGRVAEEIAQAAFATAVGEVSRPFRSPFGVHLVQVHERIDGDLSLEDARPQVLKAISKLRWQEQVNRERISVKIEISD